MKRHLELNIVDVHDSESENDDQGAASLPRSVVRRHSHVASTYMGIGSREFRRALEALSLAIRSYTALSVS